MCLIAIIVFVMHHVTKPVIFILIPDRLCSEPPHQGSDRKEKWARPKKCLDKKQYSPKSLALLFFSVFCHCLLVVYLFIFRVMLCIHILCRTPLHPPLNEV